MMAVNAGVSRISDLGSRSLSENRNPSERGQRPRSKHFTYVHDEESKRAPELKKFDTPSVFMLVGTHIVSGHVRRTEFSEFSGRKFYGFSSIDIPFFYLSLMGSTSLPKG